MAAASPWRRSSPQAGKRVFVDLKLHDIPNTVERATAQIARLGATFLTVHAYPQTMRAAVAGAKGSGLKLLAVSVLTSSDDADLAEAGYAFGVSELVERRARQAVAAGIDGLVCSPAEAAKIRAAVGDALLLVTPGVRPAGAAAGDQKRVATPAAAIADGADYLVVGRPITQDPDPRAAADASSPRSPAAGLTATFAAALAIRGPDASLAPQLREPPMPKGYVVTRVDILDPEAYAKYAAAATKAIADHGGKALARGGRYEALEGKARARNVVLEFDSYDAARRYFYSEQYQAARRLREGACEMEMVLVEGA